jgi:hypothetical protein
MKAAYFFVMRYVVGVLMLAIACVLAFIDWVRR